MKPIIEDIKDMTDSTEMYNSKPNHFLIYFIYLILGMVVIALGWMYYRDIDIVVKANGIFRYEEDSTDISSGVSGKVESCNMEEGLYVNEGDVLLTIDVESIDESIKQQEEKAEEINQRIEILEAYRKWLDGDKEIFDTLVENKYYDEFNNRRNILEISTGSSDKNIEGQKNEYQKNLDNFQKSKEQYEIQIAKLKQAEECVRNRCNTFSDEEMYYKSMVESYISNYTLTKMQYDNKRKEYQDNLTEMEADRNGESEASAVNGVNSEPESMKKNIEILEQEENNALSNLEIRQIAEIEQQIESIHVSLLSLDSSMTSVRVQMEALDKTDTAAENRISIMTEINNVDSELVTYKEKKSEYEHSLNELYIQNGKCTIKAETSGYIYMHTDVKAGMYLQEGTSIARILPEEDNGYYAEIYVENQDIAKVEKGQKVTFEIPSYPSGEYGYFTGTIDVISKDIKVDDQSGSAYYMVKVKCDKKTVADSKGNKGSIMNGMACQAKVVTDKKSVLFYVLEKIDLMD